MLTGIVVGPDQKGGQAAIIYAAGANNNGTPAEKKLHYLTRTIDLEMKEVEGNDTVSLKSIYGATVQWGDPETYDIGSTGFGMNEWPTDMGTTMFGFRQSKFDKLALDTEEGRATFESDIMNVGSLSGIKVKWSFQNWME